VADPGPKCRNCGTRAADHEAFGKCPMPEGAPANWTRHTFEPEDVAGTWPMRRSPDGRDLAICNRLDAYFPWRVTDGSQRSDRQVEDWQPVIPAIDPPAMQAPLGVTDTYVPPGNVVIIGPGVTAWSADEGGLFLRRDPAQMLAEELLAVVDGAEPDDGE
jgi:hypothetical protein